MDVMINMEKEPIRVLQVLSSLNTGGTELYVVNNYRNLNKKDVQFDFLISTDNDNDYYEQEVKSYGANVFHLANNGNIINQMRRNYLFFKQNNYSIIHINSCSLKDILIASIPAKCANIPHIIAHAHSPGTPKKSRLDYILRWILKELISMTCTDYFACSKNVAKAKYPARKLNRDVKIINNAIDLNKFKYNSFKRSEIRNRYEIRDNDFLIGMVGRLEIEKNHSYMLEVFHLIKEENYKLIIIGSGSLLDSVSKSVDELNLTDRVIFTNRVDNVFDYYSAIDLLVLPSLYEGFPFVAVEAQATGCPILISENVTDDCLLLSQSKKIPIKNGVEDWKREILFFKKNENRIQAHKIVKDAGYSITDEVNKLTQIYESMENSYD